MTGKIIKTLVFLALAQTASAQDVIVRKDGSTILSKVLEVNTADIKYKKFSNQNGPTYTINIVDIMSINYENGEKDVFDEQRQTKPVSPSYITNTPQGGGMSEASKAANMSFINAVNNITPRWIQAQKAKKANYAFNVMKIDESSVLENDDVKLHIVISMINANRKDGLVLGTENIYGQENFGIGVKVQNKTNRTIYIDLGNTFLIRGEDTQPYYTPSATSTTHGTSSGVGVNVGSVANAMGISGSIGQMASGVNVGGGSSNSTTTIEYSQRVIAIPPMSLKSLDNQLMFIETGNMYNYVTVKNHSSKTNWSFYIRSLLKGLMVGDIVHWDSNNSPISIQFHVSYAMDEQCSNLNSIRAKLYTSETYGLKGLGGGLVKGGYDVEHLAGWQNTPFHFCIENKSSEGLDVSLLNIEHTGK